MENLNLILFLSIAAPLAMMLAVCQKRSRSVLLFLILGICVCLFSSEFSGILFSILPFSSQYLTINITPLTEEVLKAIPLLIFVFMYEPEDKYVWIESHGLSYMVYTNNSGLSMLNYEKAYNAGYLTGTKDGDDAILSPTTPAAEQPTTPAVSPTNPAPSTSPADSSTADDGTGKTDETEKRNLDIGTLVSENLGAVTIIVIAAGLVATGIVLLSAKKKKENKNK